MRPELRRALLRIAALLAITGIGFLVLQAPMRRFETATTLALLHGLDLYRTSRAGPYSIGIDARDGSVFAAELTPSCSSLASVLALLGLAVLRPPGPRRRLVLAVGAAMALVFAGNVLRMAASVAFGVLAGRTSLVLFHDWAGSVFGFAYTLGGFLLMVFLLLPRDGIPLTEICAARPGSTPPPRDPAAAGSNGSDRSAAPVAPWLGGGAHDAG